MATCKEIVDDVIPIEQQDEITALEAIFQQDFRLVEDDSGRRHGEISFDLAVKIHMPFKDINIEAMIPVETEEFTSLSSSSDSEETGPEVSCGETSNLNGACSVSDENTGVVDAADGVNGGDDDHEVDNMDDKQELERPGSQTDSSATPGKPKFARSVSLQHWHVQAEVQHLTPVHLRCTLSNLYPEEQPPEFSISCLWLNHHQIQELCTKLKSLWDEMPHQPIVFTWADWLQNYSFEHLALGPHLRLRESVELSPEMADSSAAHVKLQTALLAIFENDLEMRRDEFMQHQHLCEVCFMEKDAQEFHYFDECRHFFCAECLTAHCEMHVDSGSVLQLLCPSHKCQVAITPDILQDILDSERYQRWERLMLSKTLDNMGDIVYCPRCNVPVVADEDESTKLAQCASCFYAFCTECQSQWHQGRPCWSDELDTRKTTKKKKKKKKKKKGDDDTESSDDETGGVMEEEQRKGKKLKKEQNKVITNSLKFIRTMQQMGRYKACPKCRMVVERVSGCDMMHCSQCRAQFCWSCGKTINGYDHFNGCRGRAMPARVREPTVGEQLMKEYRKANPKEMVRVQKCPRCHQENIKEANNNHITCWACKTSFCYQCKKAIQGPVMSHFAASTSCAQHSDD